MIGINAGNVWNTLNGKEGVNLKDLKKATKLAEKDLYAALGWLAREGKVELEKNELDVFVKLL